MLNRAQRIKKTDISSPKQPFTFIKTPYFSLKARKSEHSFFRFAFIISKKIDKRAVVRNTLKRRMSTAVRILPASSRGYDLLFFLRKESLTLSVEQLEGEIIQALQKYHIL